jgi:hypothetical protein
MMSRPSTVRPIELQPWGIRVKPDDAQATFTGETSREVAGTATYVGQVLALPGSQPAAK